MNERMNACYSYALKGQGSFKSYPRQLNQPKKGLVTSFQLHVCPKRRVVFVCNKSAFVYNKNSLFIRFRVQGLILVFFLGSGLRVQGLGFSFFILFLV
jgi:hypothetical protein